MIGPLNHLPRPDADADTLAERFADLAPPLNARQTALESTRRLYCYDTPYVNVCPTEIDIPGFIRSIAQGNVQGAAQKIPSANILGGSCTHVCPTETFCQRACVCSNAQECASVLIDQSQRYALDHAGFGEYPFKRSPATDKRIAVVGAGPAGLPCVHRLTMHGHGAMLFEARARAGGLSGCGIARYKLMDDFARREVEFLLQIGGIELRHGQRLGDNPALGALYDEYDAVLLGIGLATSKRLGLGDEDTPGLLAATDYTRELRQSGDLFDPPVADRCIVIGAGNTAIDMTVQMSRLGAHDVNLVYRRGFEEMGVTGHKQEIAKASQVRLLTWARPERVLLDEHGRVRGMCFARTRLENGHLGDIGEHFELAADTIFKVIGQAFEGASLGDPLAAQLRRDDERIQVDGQMRTSIPGIYVGGDCVVLGKDLTVQTVQHGKLAAEAIHVQSMLNVEAA